MGKETKKGKKAEEKPNLPVPAPVLSPEDRAKLMASYKPKRQIILPVLNLQVGAPRILWIEDAIRVSKVRDPDPAKAQEKPADVCTVTDIQSGEQFTLLVLAVIKGALEDHYADESYVGKGFYMEKLPKRAGKRYFDVKLFEVDVTKS